MEEKEILANTANTITQEPVTLTIDVLHPNWWQRWRKQTKRVFTVTPLTLGSLIRISKELLAIDAGKFDADNFMNSSYELMAEHSERMARIIAIAVSNSRNDPSASFVQFFLDNLSAKELQTATVIMLKSMDVSFFLNTIISIKGINMLMTKKEKMNEQKTSGEQ